LVGNGNGAYRVANAAMNRRISSSKGAQSAQTLWLYLHILSDIIVKVLVTLENNR